MIANHASTRTTQLYDWRNEETGGQRLCGPAFRLKRVVASLHTGEPCANIQLTKSNHANKKTCCESRAQLCSLKTRRRFCGLLEL